MVGVGGEQRGRLSRRQGPSEMDDIGKAAAAQRSAARRRSPPPPSPSILLQLQHLSFNPPPPPSPDRISAWPATPAQQIQSLLAAPVLRTASRPVSPQARRGPVHCTPPFPVETPACAARSWPLALRLHSIRSSSTFAALSAYSSRQHNFLRWGCCGTRFL